MEHNPRVGLVLIRANMRQLPEMQDAAALVDADAETAAARLREVFDLHGPWIIDSPEALQICQRALLETDLDMVVMAYQTQAGEDYLAGLIQTIASCPLVVWCYVPWRRFPQSAGFVEVLRGSGPAGTFSALGTMHNLGASFLFTYGSPDDPRLIGDLRRAGRAARLRRSLRAARYGLLPSQDNTAQSSFVDPYRLLADFGPQVQDIPPAEYRQVTGALSQAQVDAYAAQLRQSFPIYGVSDEMTAAAARAALGLAHLAAGRRLDVLAVSDTSPWLDGPPGTRPSLYPALLDTAGALFQPAAELSAATAGDILRRLTGSPVMLLELWFWDGPKNLVVGGHLGVQDPALAAPGKAAIGTYRDILHPAGAEEVQFQLMAQAGRVTLFQLRAAPHGWRAIAASGVCLEGRPWVEGYSHAVVRLDAPLEHFLNQVAEAGAARHWVLAYGSVIPELEAFCQMSRVPLEVIH